MVSYVFNYTENSNPKSVFVLPDNNIDTKTISVSVSPNVGNTSTQVYNQVTDILDITSTSEAYFLQESKNGNYEIYFGDGVIGKALNDGAVVTVTYLVTNGVAANQTDGFIAAAPIGAYSDIVIDVVDVASGGATRETVDSIKYSAAAQYATQNRLVTTSDYESYIKSKYPSIDSLSVWGGEDETPKVFGKVYISLKPKTNYFISETEKQRIIDEIINPKAIVSVSAEIRDPEFLYLIVESLVQYDQKKTSLDEGTIRNNIRQAILDFRDTNLNKFAGTFVLSKLQDAVDSTNGEAIIGSETVVRVQRRFKPKLNESASYTIQYDVPIQRGTLVDKLTSTQFTVFDIAGVARAAQFEEATQSFTGISSIQVTNPGVGFTTAPTITITGDGSNATAEAVIVNGKIQSINITNRGTDYTRATISITGGNGFGAEAVVVIDGKTGTLRTVYFDSLAQRQIINSNAGTINYDTGEIIINDIRFLSVNSDDGLIRLTIEAEKGIIESKKRNILTIDETDPTAISTILEKK